MINNFSFYVGKDEIVIFINGERFNINKDENMQYCADIIDAINDNDIKEIEYLLNNKTKILKQYVNSLSDLDGITITNDTIYIDNKEINETLSEQIIRHFESGVSIDPLVNFIRKLRDNTSYSIINQLYGFIDKSMKDGGFTIHEDGDIIAYKKVNSDYFDVYTHTISNKIGSIISMNRSDVEDNPNKTCSAGLHFCSFSYLNKYASADNCRVMLVKINPADVVSIPSDYSNAKGRCCRYEVIDELKNWNTDKDSIIKEPVLLNKKENSTVETINFNNILSDFIQYIKSEKNFDSIILMTKDNIIEKYTCKDFVEFYNNYIMKNNEEKQIKKFRDKNTAFERILNCLSYLNN